MRKKQGVLVGERHGRLTAVKFIRMEEFGSRGLRRAVWLWKCDCGNEKEIPATYVRHNGVTSCGCLLAEMRATLGKRMPPRGRVHSPDTLAAKEVYHTYQSDARSRKKVFGITFQDFVSITSRNCHYCGSEPHRTRVVGKGTFTYNGIDRVDTERGYTLDNIVPCCTYCNRAKSDMTTDEFIVWVERVYAHTRR